MTMANPDGRTLCDLRVLDFSTEIAGPYATKLFVDAGAEVVKIEPAEGDPFRRRTAHRDEGAAGDAPLFRFLHGGKRSIIGSPADPHVRALFATADLLVESGTPAFDVDTLRLEHPHLVVLSLRPYGTVGPYVDRPASPFTVEAESGSLSGRGLPDGVPYQAGGRLFEWAQGTYGAVGALAAVIRARSTGRGEWVDASLLAAANYSSSAGRVTTQFLEGDPPVTTPARKIETPTVEPAKDGWVGFSAASYQQLSDFLVLIEQPQLLDEEPNWASFQFRFEHLEEWNRHVHSWTLQHDAQEIIERATELRIPAAPVNNGRTVLTFEHFVRRDAVGPSADGTFFQPQPPVIIDGERPALPGPAPSLDEHGGAVVPRPWVPSRPAPDRERLPLDGVRVVDATAWWAGPAASGALAALGADVIHVESIARLDAMRLVIGYVQREQSEWWERSGLSLSVNTNKRDVTLPLDQEEGRVLFERLVASADVLMENFSPRVFDSFGMTPERARQLNPGLVYVRMPAFGLNGPWRDNLGMAVTMEQVTGLAWRTGHACDQPRVPRGPCDPVGGYHAAFAALSALHRRGREGTGAFVEAAMVEGILNCAAEAVVAYSADGVLIDREGNRCPEAAPQGLYQTSEPEAWLALSVTNDVEWAGLSHVLGGPSWALAPELTTHAGRIRHHDDIDERLRAWARDEDLDDAVQRLVDHGVPAGAMRDLRTADDHPQLQAIGNFEVVDHPVAGRHPVSNVPFRFASIEQWVRTAAPTLGQHNREVLTALAGLTDEAVNDLEHRGIIGTRPLGV
jgi:crotonobetainyl-CoA:carnitine CoA-transferase CaiB-like acyl-CoA transferase